MVVVRAHRSAAAKAALRRSNPSKAGHAIVRGKIVIGADEIAIVGANADLAEVVTGSLKNGRR